MPEPDHTVTPVPEVLRSRGHHLALDFRQGLAYTLAWTAMARAYDHLTHHGPFPATNVGEAPTAVLRALPEQLAQLLFNAIIGRDGSDTSTRTLSMITDHYDCEYGLIIDVTAGIIDVDRTFDAATRTRHHHDALDSCRELTALRAATAVLDPTCDGFSRSLAIPRTHRQYVRLRDQLLAHSSITEAQRRTALFLLAYLCGNTAHLDLLTDTPVLLSPDFEIKAVLRDALVAAAEPDDDWDHRPSDILHKKPFLTAAALLSRPDRREVTSRRNAILTRSGAEFEPLWPEHLNRNTLHASLRDLAQSLNYLHSGCGRLYDRTVGDDLAVEFADDIAHLTQLRATVNAVLDHPDLLAIEQIHLAHVVEGFDLGQPPPELILVGEHSKRAADRSRDTDAEFGTRLQSGERLVSALALNGIHVDFPLGPNSGDFSRAVETIAGHLVLVSDGCRIGPDELRDYSLAADTFHRFCAAELNQVARSDISATVLAALQTALLRGDERRARDHAWDTRIEDAAETTPCTTPSSAATDNGIGDIHGRERLGPAPEHTPVCPAAPLRRSRDVIPTASDPAPRRIGGSATKDVVWVHGQILVTSDTGRPLPLLHTDPFEILTDTTND
ncbi:MULTISPECIES: hypothetical protein [Nocardia]|uniref:hypothetical protein n=1 Tax=Nocardia TaxID=1817 RepID=UPI000D68AEE0|nr:MULTISPECIES: hypothetical protein [Nocardia]